MAKKTYHYYVIVLANFGPTFVTSTEVGHVAHWEKDKKPLEMSQSWADDISLGLTLHGYPAYKVTTKYELESQPFLYSKGEFQWKWNEESED